ncbi:response regulator transcription factor [Herbivorax sp. ANBcel31]|uniref:response regulator n=1 Tax=Herbivorax sp. ANBcel31 TaxID=3069754 RepID=UPI0027B50115|nr:response regulator transcription factor [Herbivorax sp. ANBcel31]MDQ2087628.1 response regulator transcription factor [Herbivorax sp. ANBcel31]
MINVLIVDDCNIIRNGLKLIIEQDKEIKIVGLATNGNKAIELSKKLKPDIILMDINMPLCNGIEATKLIKSSNKNIKIIMLTVFEDSTSIHDSLKNGADGYILKDISNEDIIGVIKNTVKGFNIMPNEVFNNIFSLTSNDISNLHLSLTKREYQIFMLIAKGMNNSQIAEKLYISNGTVRNIISKIKSKLNVKDRTQIAVYAVKNNLI